MMPSQGSVLIYLFVWTINLITPTESNQNINMYQNKQDVRIIHGSIATDQRNFAYQASLIKNGQHFCGGVILNLNHVLTAAHCVYDTRKPSNIKVKMGTLTPSLGSTTKTVKKIFMHPGFNYDTLEHDLAVLEIYPLANWTKVIGNVSLAERSPAEGTICKVSGWGKTEYSDYGSHILRYAEVPVVSKHRCKNSYGDQIKKSMFCAGFWQGGSDACQGDSGGGIICNGELAGIVSWGHECGEKDYPGVYTDVSYYKKWIASKSGSEHLLPIVSLSILVLIYAVFDMLF